MVKITQRTQNTYEASDVSTPLEITLNTSTYTTLLAPNDGRIKYTISNLSQNTVLIKEKAAADPDSSDRGFALFGRMTLIESGDTLGLGEISAKALSGTPALLVTEV